MRTFLRHHLWTSLGIIVAILLVTIACFAFLPAIQPPVVEAPTTQAPVLEVDTANLILDLGGELLALVNTYSPNEAFDRLNEVYEQEPDVAEHCHGLVHVIGHAAYEKYGFKEATAYANDACGSGYMHGLVEEYIPTLNNLEAGLPSVCTLNDGRCFHGLGHGLMTHTGNSIPQALELCDVLEQSDQRVQCGEGVFMEYYGADTEEEATADINPGEPFAACEQGWAPMYQSTCYFYTPRFYYKLNHQVDTGVFSWCNSIPSAWQYDCWRGIGSMAMKYTILNPSWVQDYCLLAPQNYQAACIRGMVGYYIVHFASVEPAELLCTQLETQFQNDCSQVIDSSRKYYSDIPKP